MLRPLILSVAGHPAVRRLVGTAPVSRYVVQRFVAGVSTAQAVAATAALVSAGLAVTLDHLGESVA
ncbi:MAG: proline dehydrogenase, partial [Pseudonocardiaceae bacterium]